MKMSLGSWLSSPLDRGLGKGPAMEIQLGVVTVYLKKEPIDANEVARRARRGIG